MMNDMMYRHVLFKDLCGYIKRTDYFSGYTETEKRYIRTNLGIDLESLKQQDLPTVLEISYILLQKLIDKELLAVDKPYAVVDFRTIYKSHELNSNNKHISYGLTTHISTPYTLIVRAINSYTLDGRIVIISLNPKSIFWIAEYDPTSKELEDGVTTLGTITYLKDENGNSANYDFKNVIWENGYTFRNDDNKESSKLCKNNEILGLNISLMYPSNNNKLSGNNIKFDIPVNNLIGTLNNVHIIKDEINLSDSNLKQCIYTPTKLYIDWLDYDTLTHQLYEL